MGAEHHSPAPTAVGGHPMGIWKPAEWWLCHLLSRRDLLELNTLQETEGCSGNLGTVGTGTMQRAGCPGGQCMGFAQSNANQFMNQLVFLFPGPQYGMSSSGLSLSPAAFCAGPSHTASGAAQEPRGRLLPSKSPFYFS